MKQHMQFTLKGNTRLSCSHGFRGYYGAVFSFGQSLLNRHGLIHYSPRVCAGFLTHLLSLYINRRSKCARERSAVVHGLHGVQRLPVRECHAADSSAQIKLYHSVCNRLSRVSPATLTETLLIFSSLHVLLFFWPRSGVRESKLGRVDSDPTHSFFTTHALVGAIARICKVLMSSNMHTV